MRDYRGHFAPTSMVYFVVKDENKSGEPARRLGNWLANNSYCIPPAVSLGQTKTLIECPYSMTHSAMSADAKRLHHLVPSGFRLSMGLEDWHDLVADIEEALRQVQECVCEASSCLSRQRNVIVAG